MERIDIETRITAGRRGAYLLVGRDSVEPKTGGRRRRGAGVESGKANEARAITKNSLRGESSPYQLSLEYAS
jgi:hypothetical protein